MLTLNTDNAIYFDVDDTLIMWSKNPIYKKKIKILDPYTKEVETLWVNESHVKLLKRMKSKGKVVVVWSHGGYVWAETVVKALELEEYVDYVMTKMEDYIDDLDVSEWCIKNIYLNKGYGR